MRCIYVVFRLRFGLLQNLHGRVPVNFVFGLVQNFSINCRGSSLINCFIFVVINASSSVFLFVLLLIRILVYQFKRFLHQKGFSFIILSCSFLSFIAVMYFEINSSSADMALKSRSSSISINLLQKSSSVSFSDCLAKKMS